MMHMIAPNIATWTMLIVLYLLPAGFCVVELFMILPPCYHSLTGYNTFGAEMSSASLFSFCSLCSAASS